MKNANKSTFSKNVARRREAINMRQIDLAVKAGYHKNLIVKIENGKSEGSATSREAIAGALNCTVADLYNDKESELEISHYKDLFREAVSIITALDEDELGAAIEVLRSFSNVSEVGALNNKKRPG